MILDHVEGMSLSADAAGRHANELNALRYLVEGLDFLFRQVKGIEDRVIQQLDPNKRVLLFGNAPGLAWVPQGLVACAFHWYATSVCNYARMVGWLANGGDSGAATRYLKTALPEVYVWRNKVAAHFAKTDPRPGDTPADLALSVMFPIGFDDDAFFASPLTLSIRHGSQSSTSRQDMRWSLTRTHSQLQDRYWPTQ